MSFPMGGEDPSENTPLSEINVTPMVDVMLVLLVIFMVTSSIETIRAERTVEDILERRYVEQEFIEQLEEHPSQKVAIELPKVNAEKVNLTEAQKLVLTLDRKGGFWIGDTLIAACGREAVGPIAKRRKGQTSLQDEAFGGCLRKLEKKLVANEKLQQDKELYLRVDESIPYGRALIVMARIRNAGITKFGLIADPELE